MSALLARGAGFVGARVGEHLRRRHHVVAGRLLSTSLPPSAGACNRAVRPDLYLPTFVLRSR